VEIFRARDDVGVVAFDVRSYHCYSEVAALPPSLDRDATPEYPMGFNGAGAGVRRRLLLDAGGYPEEFFLYWNELDLALRILQAGYRIAQYPGVVAFHKLSPGNRASTRGPFYYSRNLFWIYWKYFPLGMLLPATARLVYQCLYSCLEQKTTVYLQALWAAFSGAGMIARKRCVLREEITRQVRIAWKLAFIQYR
jgi:GT2 family glycosyltransferase